MHNPPHPGEILKELYIKPMHLTVTAVAEGIGVTRKSLSEILSKRYGISPTMAIRLGKAFSTTPESWLNLQQQYDLWQAGKKQKASKVTVFLQAQIHAH